MGEQKIVCGISLTSTDAQEFSITGKCLKAGDDKVILCSPREKTLKKVKVLAF